MNGAHAISAALRREAGALAFAMLASLVLLAAAEPVDADRPVDALVPERLEATRERRAAPADAFPASSPKSFDAGCDPRIGSTR